MCVRVCVRACAACLVVGCIRARLIDVAGRRFRKNRLHIVADQFPNKAENKLYAMSLLRKLFEEV
jgi:hypothetical protein